MNSCLGLYLILWDMISDINVRPFIIILTILKMNSKLGSHKIENVGDNGKWINLIRGGNVKLRIMMSIWGPMNHNASFKPNISNCSVIFNSYILKVSLGTCKLGKFDTRIKFN